MEDEVIEAWKKISSEIDENQIRVILSTQCQKAQTLLIIKLKKKAERSKEICSFMCAANLKLNDEIAQADQQIKSMLLAKESIDKANIQLRKELLMTKQRKLDIIERMRNGEKKYEELWLESKARYESLPHVQKLLKAKEEIIRIQDKIIELENEKKSIREGIKSKKESCLAIDRQRIIEFAEFMVKEMPQIVNVIKEKSAAIKDIENQINNLKLKENDDATTSKLADEDGSKTNNASACIMPTLQLDLDFGNFENFEKKSDALSKTPDRTYRVHSVIVIDPSKHNKKKTTNKSEEYFFSSFHYKHGGTYEEDKTENYAKKKLINILDDIKVDKGQAQKMIADANPLILQPVDKISVDDHLMVEKNQDFPNTKGNNLVDEYIEEIDLTASNTGNIMNIMDPPSQFIDSTPKLQESQKEYPEAATLMETPSQGEFPKKRVKFDIPEELETYFGKDAQKPEDLFIDDNVTINSELNTSDERFAKMQDMLMKKHNLDLSPQFVYSKNNMTALKHEEKVVTSKFFTQENNENYANVDTELVQKITTEVEEDDQKEKEITEIAKDTSSKSSPRENYTTKSMPNENNLSKLIKNDKLTINELDDDSSQIRKKIQVFTQAEKPSQGISLNYNESMTVDCLDESNATGFEDTGDFPYLDSSILTSPKADIIIPNLESQEVLSQDVPNFFSGLRKTGLSFFGGLGSSESKPESSIQKQTAHNQGSNGFNFTFGGEEKKSRGGLFSMFQ